MGRDRYTESKNFRSLDSPLGPLDAVAPPAPESTAIPTVKIIPAIPGKVNVASNNDNTPINSNKLVINVKSAISPKILYLIK